MEPSLSQQEHPRRHSRRWWLGATLLTGLLVARHHLDPNVEPLSSRAARAVPVVGADAARTAMIGIDLPDWADSAEASTGAGSAAFFVSADGLAVTSYHALGGVRRFDVSLAADRSKRFEAHVVAASQCDDLAVIQVEVDDVVPYLEWYHGPVGTGLEVTSLGYTSPSATFTSATGTVVGERVTGVLDTMAATGPLIRHDATAGVGFVGGPLLTVDGVVVAVNAIGIPPVDGRTVTGAAIPSSFAEPVVAGLRDERREVGIDVELIDPALGLPGVVVTGLVRESPGDWAELEWGDVIVSIGGHAVGVDGTMTGYCEVIRSVGTDLVELEVFRAQRNERVRLQLNGPRPSDSIDVMG